MFVRFFLLGCVGLLFGLAFAESSALKIQPLLTASNGLKKATLDETGRLLVIESNGRIVRLTPDRKRTKFEKLDVFSTEMNVPQDLAWVQEGLYVLGDGGLWRITSGESPRALITGFSEKVKFRGPVLHPNGRLFWSTGVGAHEVYDPDTGELVSDGDEAWIWSCRIDGVDIERYARNPLARPVELNFSEMGEVFADGRNVLRGEDEIQFMEPAKGPSPKIAGISAKVTDRLAETATSELAVADRLFRVGPLTEGDVFGNEINWEYDTAEALSAHLDTGSAAVRERTISALAGMGDPALPELRRILEDGKSTSIARRNAIWTLARLRFSHSTDLILTALKDPDPTVEAAAANAIAATRDWRTVAFNLPNEASIEIERNHQIVQELVVLVGKGSVSMVPAVEALGRLGDPAAAPALISLMGRKSVSPGLEHAVSLALTQIQDSVLLRDALRDGGPLQQRVALVVLDRIEPDLGALAVLPHLDSEDEALRRVAIELVAKRDLWDAALANRFLDWLDSDEGITETRHEVIAELAPKFLKTPPIQSFLADLINLPDAPEKLRELAAQVLGSGAKIEGK